LVASSLASATTTIPSISGEGSVSVEQLDATIAAIEASEDVDEETQEQVIALLRDAQAHVRNRLAFDDAAKSFAESLDTAPEETSRLRAELDQPLRPPPTAESLRIGTAASLQELDQAMARELAELASLEARLAEIESRIGEQEARPAQARARINELRGNRDRLNTVLEAKPPADEPALLTGSRKLAAELRRNSQDAELTRLEQELLSHSVRLTLLKARRDVAARELAYEQQVASVLQGLVNERRQSAAARAQLDAELAELAAEGKHPVVRKLAQGNAELTRELPEVAAGIERVTGQLAAAETEARAIEEGFARSRQRLEVGGVSQVIGRLFVDERENLPKVAMYRSQVRERQAALAEIGLAQVRIEEQQRDLARLDVAVETYMADVPADISSDAERADIRGEVENLLRVRRDLLQQVGDTYTRYLQMLGDLDIAQRRLLDVTADYRQFLDQHLLWIPSASVFGREDIKSLPKATAWMLSPSHWAETASALVDGFVSSPVAGGTALIVLLVVIGVRRSLKVQSRELNSRVGRLSTDNIGLTLAGMGIAAIRALPVPLALFIAGAALTGSPSQTDFTAAVAAALFAVAPFLYNLALFRVLCAKKGIMQLHFGWTEQSLAIIRRQLTRLIVIATPIVFFTVLVFVSPIPAYRESLARLGFVVALVILSISLYPLSHPTKGVAATYYARSTGSWISRLRWLWFAIAVGGPLLLALAASVGYLYTAATLVGDLIDTVWLVVIIIVVNLVVLRWLALERRKIAWQIVLEKREARMAELSADKDADSEGEAPTVERKPLDLDAVDQQTRRLLHAGLFFFGVIAAWGIWSEILPALGILEQISVWNRSIMVDGSVTIRPVTLADILLALVVIAVTIVASRNLPGLMEIAVLQRIELQHGSRYTINTLLRYVVVTIGVIAVLNIVGLNWSKIQWLVAALSVGLGFGLQEIVANFFSGLIILFERPVRVGDTVTVGQLTGTVSKVRIRATTITDWDRKEIIVPNKAFITEQVVNWTLSDPITRIVIPVGISYGSDVQLATRIMEQALAEMPIVLDEPGPKVYFMGFGDSSLNFNLYVFSRQLSDRLPLMHAVHEQILAALRENGIEIPFPQRDLHVKSVADDVKGAVRGQGRENVD
jgi:potassium efflux system protein